MQPELIICEQTGRWADAWRRAASRSRRQMPVHEVRSTDDCRRRLRDARAGFVLVEMTRETAVQALELLDWLQRACPAARAAVVAERGCERVESLAREYGAIHFVNSPRRLSPLVDVVGRYLAALPPVEQSVGDQVWQRLPWSPVAAATATTPQAGTTEVS